MIDYNNYNIVYNDKRFLKDIIFDSVFCIFWAFFSTFYILSAIQYNKGLYWFFAIFAVVSLLFSAVRLITYIYKHAKEKTEIINHVLKKLEANPDYRGETIDGDDIYEDS